MDPNVKKIEMCRVCSNKHILPILSLGEQFFTDFITDKEKQGIRAPLELVLCDQSKGGCGLLQLKHTITANAMYRQYWYQSGINKSMQDALADISKKAQSFVKLKENDIVLDIGCNDGTLLRSYGKKNLRSVGFDPAVNLIPLASKGTTKIINDFFNAESFQKEFGSTPAKIITSIAMFYDLDNPNIFVADIAKILDKNGVWIIQMSYLPSMINKNAFDNICHEHLEYYSLSSLENLLSRHKLVVIDVETNDVNGGSFRVYIAHEKSAAKFTKGNSEKNVSAMRKNEKKIGLEKREVYNSFANRIRHLKTKTVAFIKKEVKNKKKVFVYGASTKGNVLLQYYGLDSTLIARAAERNQSKWGKMTVGTLIPIVSEEEARKQKPDYFLVLPWHFLNEFLQRERAFLKSGGKFIVPLPEVKVIDSKKETFI
ncbi:MAG TPA: class I SAM-dependent methyltransferase [archaeon]|nr:class I SAM-dependent methyltransferase [archaeon]